jgi:iron complex transport system permease protein
MGAVISIAFGLTIPGLGGVGEMAMAMVFAFFSLIIILSLSYKIDYSLSTNTIILIGMIFTMFASSVISLVIAFAGEKVHTVVFWLMGSLAGAKFKDVLILLGALLVFGSVIISHARELTPLPSARITRVMSRRHQALEVYHFDRGFGSGGHLRLHRRVHRLRRTRYTT